MQRFNEPVPEGEDWIEWGGQLTWAMGYTSGGAPFGLSIEDFRSMNEESFRGKGWALAKDAIRRAVSQRFDGEGNVAIDVGWVVRIGEGLDRGVYAAEVSAVSDTQSFESRLVALVPRSSAAADLSDRVRREIGLLHRLAELKLPFRVPRPEAFVEGSPILVREMVPGMPFDFFSPQAGRQPWQVIASAAVAVHEIDLGDVAGLLPGYSTRRAHAQARLAQIDAIGGEPLTDEILSWIREHLPPGEEEARVLHGDLLPQNLLIDFDRLGDLPTIIDWEFAMIGDPAFDLSIVTRGVRRPFKQVDGLDRLLASYEEAGGQEITRSEVHLHELCLLGGWYLEACRGEHQESPTQVKKRLGSLFRRVGECTN